MSKISISPGNKKIGRIPNISLPPGLSCKPDAPCIDSCYALKAYRFYKEVREAWNKNLSIALYNTIDYFQQINSFLSRTKKTLFRYHVSGDILSQNYLNKMVDTALQFPTITFFTYTKKYDLDFSMLPHNLIIRLSIWPNHPYDNPYNLPLSYMQDGTETRIPDKRVICPGDCTSCNACWSLPKIPIQINKH